jgi:hypothetical protein
MFSGTFRQTNCVRLYVNGGFTTMRIQNKLSIGAALIGSVILSFAGAAQADDHWDHDRYRDHDRGYHHEREHERHERVERRVVEHRYVEERPVYVERPMMVAPPVVYQPSGPPSMNLNFNIPLN